MHRKSKESPKTRALERLTMYRIPKNEPEFEKFDMVFGGKLNRENRWVVLADLIPWDEVEKRYSKLFAANNGRPALSVRVALGALIIKEKKNVSDEELVEDIRESPYLQYFLGYEGYKDELPFDPSMMVHFRKRLSGTILKEINALIIEAHKQEPAREDKEDDDDDPSASAASEEKNRGTLIVDATCAPEDMRFPNDVSLLDEARRKTEKIIDVLHEQAPAGYAKPRTYRKRARKEFLTFIRNRKPRETTIRNAIRKQLQYVERNLRIISDYREHAGCDILTRKQYRDLVVISELARQQRELYRRKSHSLAGRIVSIAKPYVRPIARGKARGMYEFGAKLSVSLEAYRQRYGRYPEVVCADKIYRTRENLQYCQEKGIRLSGPKLGRPFQEREKNRERIREQRRTEREDERTRIAVEGKFGEGKRRYSLDRIGTKLRETSESAIMMVFLVMNLMVLYRKKAKAFFAALLETLFELVRKGFKTQNWQLLAA
ncbi:MAG TPA: IS5 family transposase [Rectinema sp.]|nr:IS5 family transposase [Rectinema sp.]